MSRAWNGMNWIRQEKRLAIYLRDGMCCAWCGLGVEDEVVLSLDHLKPHAKGGANDATNLVTCCKACNSARGKRSQASFARAVAEYLNHGVTAADILANVKRCSQRSLAPYIIEARALIASRGSAAQALAAQRKGVR